MGVEDDQKAFEERGLVSFHGVEFSFVFHAERIEANELCAEERHHRHGEEVGREDRKHDSQRQRREDVLAHAAERSDGKEDDGGGECGGQHGHGDFGAAFRRGDWRRLAQLHMAINVLEHNHAVIDQAREDQRQPGQNHGVDGAAHEVDDQQADQHGERNGEQHRDGGARAAQKYQDHHSGHHEPDNRFARDVGDGQLDEDRLIEDHGGLESVGNIDEFLDRGFDAVDDLDGVLSPPCLKMGT